jgi:phosphatidate phosphatase PAH1
MQRWMLAVVLASLGGCVGNIPIDPYAPTHGDIAAGPVPDVRCAGAPAGQPRGFRIWRHTLTAKLAHPNHRGVDLIATTEQPQVLSGKLAYGITDKKLDGEQVELFACLAGTWNKLGSTYSDHDGRWTLTLPAAARMPVGLRDLYASVVADRSGVRFVAYVAPPDARLVVSDIDGTLTSSESSFVKAVVLGSHVEPHPEAAASLRAARDRGYQVIYVTARSDRFTDVTRHWLGTHGFPRGPLRLAPSLIVKPGDATVAYKRNVLGELAGFELVAGVGNRKSDVTAYTAAGMAPEHIFVKLPEYEGELGAALSSGAAIGFGAYGPLALP